MTVKFLHVNLQSFMILALLIAYSTKISWRHIMYSFHVFSHQIHVSALFATYSSASEAIFIWDFSPNQTRLFKSPEMRVCNLCAYMTCRELSAMLIYGVAFSFCLMGLWMTDEPTSICLGLS